MEAQSCHEASKNLLLSHATVDFNICKCCDEMGSSCCRVPKAEQGLIPPISMGEIGYIRKHGGLPGKAGRSFVVRKPNSKPFVKKMLDLFPYRSEEVRHVFPRRGMHYELAIVNERCILLGPQGCILPRHARPLLCRIYPFWFYGEEPYIFANEQCLALQRCKTVQDLSLALRTNLGELYELYSQLCKRWGFSHELHLPAANEGIYPYKSSSPMYRQGLFSNSNGV